MIPRREPEGDQNGSKEKVDFSLQMYDTIGTGKLKQDEVIKLLSAINRTASYFGDPCLTEQQVRG